MFSLSFLHGTQFSTWIKHSKPGILAYFLKVPDSRAKTYHVTTHVCITAQAQIKYIGSNNADTDNSAWRPINRCYYRCTLICSDLVSVPVRTLTLHCFYSSFCSFFNGCEFCFLAYLWPIEVVSYEKRAGVPQTCSTCCVGGDHCKVMYLALLTVAIKWH